MECSQNETGTSTVGQDRRAFGRYPTQPTSVRVEFDQFKLDACVFDQSIGGLGVLVADASRIKFGQKVTVVDHDTKSVGYVRGVMRDPGGGFRVNISWEPAPHSADPAGKSIVQYVAHGPLYFACEVLEDRPGPLVNVRLWNGSEFEVSAHQVCFRSPDARRTELLGNTGQLATLAHVYGLPTQQDPASLLQSILDFEFSLT